MDKLLSIINIPFAWVLRNIAAICGGNFAAAVAIFTLLINIVLIPLSIKSQKSSVQQTRIKPKMDDLKKRYGDDKMKYNEAVQKLQQEEGVSLSGGCLPLILRLVLMMSIYYLIMQPLTYLLQVDANVIKEAAAAIADGAKNTRATELTIIDAVKAGKINFPEIASHLGKIDFGFLGINLTETPKFSFDFTEAKLIWIMPFIAFAAQILSSLMSMAMQKKINPDAPSMMGMMLGMPVISLFIGFSLPGGVTFYWACSSLIGGIIQVGVQYFYGPHKMLARERAKELIKQCEFEESQLKKLTDDNLNN